MTLVGHWPLQEDSGGTAYDFSGNGNDGTTNGGVTQGATGLLGTSAYSFDGADDYIQVNTIPSLVESTMAAWTKPNNYHSTVVGLSEGDGTTERATIRIQKDDSTLDGPREILLTTYDGSNFGGLSSGIEPTLGEWYHVVAYINTNGQAEIWVNGVLENSTDSINYASDTSAFRMAQYPGGPSENLDGSIADVRLYNRALTPAEIQYLYQTVAGEGRLVTDWRTL